MRILVISDIHGNLAAMRAVVAAEPEVDRVLCLGDLVDYGPRPHETVAWVREHAFATVRGNHDNAVALGADCRSAPAFRRLSVETRKKTSPLMTEDDLSYLRSLQTRVSLEIDGKRLALLHAAPDDPLFRYLPASRVDEWRAAASGIDADLLLVGHTHLPALRDLGGKTLLNPGSVGLPRDGDPRAAYAVLDGGTPALKRVAYDVDGTVSALHAWGLPEDVARSLEELYRGDAPLSPFAAGSAISPTRK